jgi:DNA-directed RNA polymerase III subunit RPC1
VVSSLLRSHRQSRVVVNFALKEKRYEGGECLCPRDGYVLFHNSELVCGQLGKPTLGGNKKGLLFALIRDNGYQAAVAVMTRFAKLAGRWFSQHGFTIGFGDVTPSAELATQNRENIQRAMEECEDLRIRFKKGELKAEAGKSPEQVLESLTNQTLSKVREIVGDNCSKFLPKENKPLIMSVCGAKGSPINLSQMIGCVGQQTVGGKRIGNGFTGRSLPHFKTNVLDPVARGFVRNSFNSGLTAIEFFFHTMGGREGLIDTAVKTAETGYMQRRLIKLLEDVSVMYDQTVRSCDRQQLVQIRYGEDGLNPMFSESTDQPINISNLEAYARMVTPAREGEQPLSSEQLDAHYSAFKAERLPGLMRHDPEAKLKFTGMLDGYVALKAAALREAGPLRSRLVGLTLRQLHTVTSKFWERASRSLVEPGETVGAVTAQSIGEPATQMTLKTFHFAGISSMNITQGVPRMNEIINAAPTISTPIIDIRLTRSDSVEEAIRMQRSLQVTHLKEVCEEIKEVYSQAECFLELRFSPSLLAVCSLSLAEVAAALAAQKLGLKRERIKEVGGDRLRIGVAGDKRNEVFELRQLCKSLPESMVKGVKSLRRVLVNHHQGAYNLFAEGRGLAAMLESEGVDKVLTRTNHIVEVEEVLGVEAARRSIIDEISSTMNEHGVSIDIRHVYLLSEIMCWRGKVTGFNRYGVDKFKDSTLMLASFEKTTDFLFDAGAMAKLDRLKGCSERIITGRPLIQGTGSFDLFVQ